MALRIYNSLTRKKEEFVPSQPGKVGLYVCGVTVYDDPHVGHARCYVAFDAIIRHFKARGYDVTYVRNFTDVDDKIIKRANELDISTGELSERYIDSFSKDMASLGVLPASIEPKATEHIKEIIDIAQDLIEKGHAYESGGDVYFRVQSFKGYGKLSGRDIEQMQAGARIEVDERKEHPMDFVLWKASKPGEPSWESPWGQGRPGWHIECSAMSLKYLGGEFDIHGGGKDLIFPHHENEVAQSECATGQGFARFWVHNGFVQVNQEKMSKSLGNFFTIKDILKTTRPEVLRFFLLSKHYRSPIDFSDQALSEAAQGMERLYRALAAIDQEVTEPLNKAITHPDDLKYMEEINEAAQSFEDAMDDDFNTAAALGALFALAKIANRLVALPQKEERDALLSLCRARLSNFGARLGILNSDPTEYLQTSGVGQDATGPSAEEIEALIEERKQARKDKNFARADEIRDQLAAQGVMLEDTPQGTRWHKE
ncbi:cysteine--tRNA ligase [Dethiosulfatarculus sandiegensis]|uniref:Cysteine--tRNA ligase n=1 Tax=Dethiosulfatarculus sandiegensis TaxID=1429043 RepID=A0A0D2J3Q1_9BACT|nr:cysteine--tRNA ligase [Dethiosulfatarculus sandiegensis]KIX12814.1 cysteinyl-tRNA synthetase [Dethiosulfatarculus sandiegensis]